MPGREGDQVREALHGDLVAVMEVAPDRLGEGKELGHQRFPSDVEEDGLVVALHVDVEAVDRAVPDVSSRSGD